MIETMLYGEALVLENTVRSFPQKSSVNDFWDSPKSTRNANMVSRFRKEGGVVFPGQSTGPNIFRACVHTLSGILCKINGRKSLGSIAEGSMNDTIFLTKISF